MNRCLWGMGAGVGLMLVTGGASLQAEALPAGATTFFQANCYKCHGPELQKGRLRLDTLTADFSDPMVVDQWTKVIDVLELGEMPPTGEPRPDKEHQAALLDWLHRTLDHAQSTAVATQGRSSMRRLTRLEYERTVNELLGTNQELHTRLPRENHAHGFNKVPEALGLSTELMLLYWETARHAVHEALATREPIEPEVIEANYLDDDRLHERLLKKEGGAVIFSGYSPTEMRASHVEAPGKYHVVFEVATHADPDGPLSLGVYRVSLTEGATEAIAFYDVAEKEPQTFEFDVVMAKRDRLKFLGIDNPRLVFGKDADPENTPGIWIGDVKMTGPLEQESPQPSRALLLGDVDLDAASGADLRRRLEVFLARAFRRPLLPGEAAPFIELMESELEATEDPRLAFETGLAAVLCAPQFLYLEKQSGSLADFQLASRLSYFLWNTMPDQELLQLALDGRLHEEAILAAQVERMIEDPKFESFIVDFTDQWLRLEEINDTAPDESLYPEHNDYLQASMLKETRAYFRELIRANLPVDYLIDGDFIMVNRLLAKHYDLENVSGHELQRVALPDDSPRGGFLTQASVLKVSANGSNTSPVIRGVYVLEHLLGLPPSPPPPGVGSVEPDIRGTTTIREQLSAHRRDPSCNVCHEKIDPPGFALENFDVIGGWRENYRSAGEGKRVEGKRYRIGLPVDASGTAPGGREFSDIQDFKQILLEDREQLARSLAEKFLIYATGEPIELAGRDELEQIVTRSREQGFGIRALLHATVQSPLFTQK